MCSPSFRIVWKTTHIDIRPDIWFGILANTLWTSTSEGRISRLGLEFLLTKGLDFLSFYFFWHHCEIPVLRMTSKAQAGQRLCSTSNNIFIPSVCQYVQNLTQRVSVKLLKSEGVKQGEEH